MSFLDDEDIVTPEKEVKPLEERKSFDLKVKALLLVIFLLALLPRLYYLFFVSDPQNAAVGWYNDTYHHWQIGYLTQQIGLGQGFLRLWDLQGMEYFWGLLHPMVLTVLFTLTRSADILIPRLLDVFAGSFVITVVFLLTKRYFNLQVALAASFLAIINPVGIFTDTSGMVEPLGILMLLLGVYFWPQKPVKTAIFWFLASLTRAEYWVFASVLIVILAVFDKKAQNRTISLVVYFGLILFYLKYLLDKTGNAIYPIYWNFLGNAAGKWQADIPLTAEQAQVRTVFLALLVVSLLASLFFLIKRPKMYIFSLLGTGNLVFLALFVGFTQYLKSYLPRFWVDRIFWLPYLWLGWLVAVILLYFLPRKLRLAGSVAGWILVIFTAAAVQFAWGPIKEFSGSSGNILKAEMKLGKEVSSFYKGGSILIPGTDPVFTYALYKNGIEGKDMRGEVFDPYFYFTGPDPYLNWGENRKIVLDWFKKENIKLLFFDRKEDRYLKLVDKEKDKFKKLGTVEHYEIYEVNQ